MNKNFKKFNNFMYLITDVAKMIGILSLVISVTIPLVVGIMITKENINLDTEYINFEGKYGKVFLQLNDIANDYDINIVNENKLDFKALVIVFITKSIETIFVVLILDNLCKIFKNIKKDETPFSSNNIKYIKRVSLNTVLAVVVPYVLIYLVALAIGIQVSFAQKITTLIYAMATVAIAYIFEYGCKLQKESDETL